MDACVDVQYLCWSTRVKRLHLSISWASMYAPTSAWQKVDLQFPSARDELAREVLLEPDFNDSFIVHGITYVLTNVSDSRLRFVMRVLMYNPPFFQV